MPPKPESAELEVDTTQATQALLDDFNKDVPISGFLNGCSLYAFVPAINSLIKQLAHGSDQQPKFTPYLDSFKRLKTIFADYHGIDPSIFTWVEFSALLDALATGGPSVVQIAFAVPLQRFFVKPSHRSPENAPEEYLGLDASGAFPTGNDNVLEGFTQLGIASESLEVGIEGGSRADKQPGHDALAEIKLVNIGMQGRGAHWHLVSQDTFSQACEIMAPYAFVMMEDLADKLQSELITNNPLPAGFGLSNYVTFSMPTSGLFRVVISLTAPQQGDMDPQPAQQTLQKAIEAIYPARKKAAGSSLSLDEFTADQRAMLQGGAVTNTADAPRLTRAGDDLLKLVEAAESSKNLQVVARHEFTVAEISKMATYVSDVEHCLGEGLRQAASAAPADPTVSYEPVMVAGCANPKTGKPFHSATEKLAWVRDEVARLFQERVQQEHAQSAKSIALRSSAGAGLFTVHSSPFAGLKDFMVTNRHLFVKEGETLADRFAQVETCLQKSMTDKQTYAAIEAILKGIDPSFTKGRTRSLFDVCKFRSEDRLVAYAELKQVFMQIPPPEQQGVALDKQ